MSKLAEQLEKLEMSIAELWQLERQDSLAAAIKKMSLYLNGAAGGAFDESLNEQRRDVLQKLRETTHHLSGFTFHFLFKRYDNVVIVYKQKAIGEIKLYTCRLSFQKIIKDVKEEENKIKQLKAKRLSELFVDGNEQIEKELNRSKSKLKSLQKAKQAAKTMQDELRQIETLEIEDQWWKV